MRIGGGPDAGASPTKRLKRMINVTSLKYFPRRLFRLGSKYIDDAKLMLGMSS